jgi:hypothetical protein
MSAKGTAPNFRNWRKCEVQECPLLRLYWRNRGHNLDIAKLSKMTQSGLRILESIRRGMIATAEALCD